jgi:hypothetical protein
MNLYNMLMDEHEQTPPTEAPPYDPILTLGQQFCLREIEIFQVALQRAGCNDEEALLCEFKRMYLDFLDDRYMDWVLAQERLRIERKVKQPNAQGVRSYDRRRNRFIKVGN